MGLVTTGSHPKMYWPGVYGFFGLKYNEFPEQWRDLVTVKLSKQAYEEEVYNRGMGMAPVKTQGGGVSFDDTAQFYVNRATHLTYGIGGIVTREAIDDNLYKGQAMNLASEIAFSIRQTTETVVANMYNRGFNPAYTFGDGVNLLSQVHPNSSGGTFSNVLSTAGVLTEATLEDLLIMIRLATNDRGHKISLQPDCVIIHPQNEYEANRILKSVNQSNTAENNINVIRAINSVPGGLKVNNYMNDANAFFVRARVPKGDLSYFNRRSHEFTKDNEFTTENAMMKGTIRFSVTCGDPRALWGSNPA